VDQFRASDYLYFDTLDEKAHIHTFITPAQELGVATGYLFDEMDEIYKHTVQSGKDRSLLGRRLARMGDALYIQGNNPGSYRTFADAQPLLKKDPYTLAYPTLRSSCLGVSRFGSDREFQAATLEIDRIIDSKCHILDIDVIIHLIEGLSRAYARRFQQSNDNKLANLAVSEFERAEEQAGKSEKLAPEFQIRLPRARLDLARRGVTRESLAEQKSWANHVRQLSKTIGDSRVVGEMDRFIHGIDR